MKDNTDNSIVDMYGDIDTSDLQPRHKSIGVKYSGQLTEIEIENKKITIVDHNMIKNLDGIVRSMQKQISALEQEVLNLKSRLQRAERNLVSIKVDLDTKVSYE